MKELVDISRLNNMTREAVKLYAETQALHKENLVLCYMMQTGFRPSEIILVEEMSADGKKIS